MAPSGGRGVHPMASLGALQRRGPRATRFREPYPARPPAQTLQREGTRGEKVKAQKGKPATARSWPTASTRCARGAEGRREEGQRRHRIGARARGGLGDKEADGGHRRRARGPGGSGARREDGRRREVRAGGRAARGARREDGRRREVRAGGRAARGARGVVPPKGSSARLNAKMAPKGGIKHAHPASRWGTRTRT